ncbi:MAG: hypothetical protein ABJH82_06780 [Polaribacter sp.]|uniref:hypothetical protein n=1 Tax=Polaribacter sp. TaxID=1920175 RepID=UPI0032661CDB
MKKIAAIILLSLSLFSCNVYNNMTSSNFKQAQTLLSSLSADSSVKQISTLLTLLDTNKNNTLESTETVGAVEENFNLLDTDHNLSLSLEELKGLLPLLKK